MVLSLTFSLISAHLRYNLATVYSRLQSEMYVGCIGQSSFFTLVSTDQYTTDIWNGNRAVSRILQNYLNLTESLSAHEVWKTAKLNHVQVSVDRHTTLCVQSTVAVKDFKILFTVTCGLKLKETQNLESNFFQLVFLSFSCVFFFL